MFNNFSPQFNFPKKKKITIIASRFNDFITAKLTKGATNKLKEFGFKKEDLAIYWVPGSLELPIMAKRVILQTKPDAIIAIGAVIRGETDHYNIVINESAKGLSHVSLETNTPILNCILTCDNSEQAIARSGIKAGNKGSEAALSALELLSVFDQLEK